jgi:hypothetical protein
MVNWEVFDKYLEDTITFKHLKVFKNKGFLPEQDFFKMRAAADIIIDRGSKTTTTAETFAMGVPLLCCPVPTNDYMHEDHAGRQAGKLGLMRYVKFSRKIEFDKEITALLKDKGMAEKQRNSFDAMYKKKSSIKEILKKG